MEPSTAPENFGSQVKPVFMRTRWKILPLFLFTGIVLGILAFWALHQRYIPTDAIETSQRFISLIEAGNLREAYALTTQDALSGSTFEAFTANAQHRIDSRLGSNGTPIRWKGVHYGFQSYGNRLRRWLAGRKLDPDTISLEFDVGAPFEVRVVSSSNGKWKISYFQIHAG
jgi:hypothetical protein